jgi:hypothetical protein
MVELEFTDNDDARAFEPSVGVKTAVLGLAHADAQF